jgi:hypothetical protein
LRPDVHSTIAISALLVSSRESSLTRLRLTITEVGLSFFYHEMVIQMIVPQFSGFCNEITSTSKPTSKAIQNLNPMSITCLCVLESNTPQRTI